MFFIAFESKKRFAPFLSLANILLGKSTTKAVYNAPLQCIHIFSSPFLKEKHKMSKYAYEVS